MALAMYILLRDDLDNGHAGLAIAHGVLACYLRFKDDPLMSEWLSESYRKRLCALNRKEFERAKMFNGSVLMTESGLENSETALVFCPRPDDKWDKPFKFYKLWTGQVRPWNSEYGDISQS